MPSRLERILRILLMLQTRVPYDTIQLSQEMKVHRRTIFRDIAALRDLGVQIDFDIETACYTLSRESEFNLNSIGPQELTELLYAACQGIPKDGSTGEAIKRAVLKLAARLPEPVRNHISSLTIAEKTERVQDVGTFRGLVPLTAAIRSKREILIGEVGTAGECVSRELVPESLTFGDEGWILKGHDLEGTPVSYFVDRYPLAVATKPMSPAPPLPDGV
ncbi:HTH domain protein [Roseimaritima multifibrata]|uniref:HTH domain protein n=1 Tax=Roseimaritima multifibrata TaxID=1930274 RepID=A0A517MFK7_9BACT|nr:HTH domain-containing protein [Roseimaritima multifibrata]QDS93674.1 HTH domain protein [Roseimaritima multifibrata]